MLMPSPHQYKEFAEQEEQTYTGEADISDKFDWRAISILCVSGIPKHKAYGMTFPDYRERRESVVDEDTTEKKRLSFYVPKFPAMMAMSYSLKYKCSHHKFVLLIIELGLIHFQYDYHDDYHHIKKIKCDAMGHVIDETSRIQYMRLSEQQLSICSGSASSINAPKHYSPSVPEWLYNAISDLSIYLNMSITDVVYLCYCNGIVRCLPEQDQNVMLMHDCNEILLKFGMQLKSYILTIKNIPLTLD